MGTVRTALVLIGTTAGAGFVTGAEFARFFGGEGYFGALVAAFLLYGGACAFFLKLGARCGGFANAMQALFRGGAGVLSCVLLALSFVPCAGMLAALDALAPAWKPLPSLMGLGCASLFAVRGTGGVSLLHALLVPVLLGSILLTADTPAPATVPSLSEAGQAVLYAGANIAFSAPALMETGRRAAKPLASSFLAAALMLLCAVLIAGTLHAAGSVPSPMPYLTLKGGRWFSFAVAAAVITSLAGAIHPLLRTCENVCTHKNAAKGGVLLAAFLLSRLGFTGVIGTLYPVAGVFGILLSAVLVLDEHLLQKHHQRIHPRRKKA